MLARMKSSLRVSLEGRDDEGLSIHLNIGTRLVEVLSVIPVSSELVTEVELDTLDKKSKVGQLEVFSFYRSSSND
jgi:hypothetical protein